MSQVCLISASMPCLEYFSAYPGMHIFEESQLYQKMVYFFRLGLGTKFTESSKRRDEYHHPVLFRNHKFLSLTKLLWKLETKIEIFQIYSMKIA